MIRSDTKSFTSTFSVARWDKSKTDTTWTRRHCKENANLKMYYLIKKKLLLYVHVYMLIIMIMIMMMRSINKYTLLNYCCFWDQYDNWATLKIQYSRSTSGLLFHYIMYVCISDKLIQTLTWDASKTSLPLLSLITSG